MDRQQLRDHVRAIIGETTEADFWTDPELNRWLNEAQRRFLQSEKWPWLVTEATGQLLTSDSTPGELSLQEGVSSYRHVNFLLSRDGVAAPWQPTRVLPASGFMLRTRFYTSAAYPSYFYITSVVDSDDDGQYETVARFLPAPSVNIDVTYQYYRTPVDMSGDTDVPDVPLEYHMALVHYAAARAWEKELAGGPKAGEQDDLYTFILTQARDEYLNSEPDSPLIAGSEPPQPGSLYGTDYYMRSRIPDTLGP